MNASSLSSGSFSLRRLLPAAEVHGAEDVLISGCTDNWRKVRPGNGFVVSADSGEKSRQALLYAIERGCAVVIADHLLGNVSVPVCLVSDARKSYGRLCHQLTGNPCEKLNIIGVAGRQGRTTTACLIAGVLRAAEHRIGMVGSLGCLDGRTIFPTKHITPPVDRLVTLLARMVCNQCSHTILEVSWQAIAEERLAGTTLDIACVADGGEPDLPESAQRTGSEQARMKRLFDYLKEDGLVVLNADNPGTHELLCRLERPTLTVAVRVPAEIMATPVEQSLSEQTFLLTAGSETVPVRTCLIGRKNIYNCLTAAAVGLSYGIELAVVVRGLESVTYVPGRLQRLECGQPFAVFVDCIGSGSSLLSTLKTLRPLTSGRLICLLSNEQLKRKYLSWLPGIKRYVDLVILTGGTSKTKTAAAGLRELPPGLSRPEHIKIILDRRTAIHFALSTARAGDCLLIWSNPRAVLRQALDRCTTEDDEEVVREWLFEHQGEVFTDATKGEKFNC